jgi:hypothetical protein
MAMRGSDAREAGMKLKYQGYVAISETSGLPLYQKLVIILTESSPKGN